MTSVGGFAMMAWMVAVVEPPVALTVVVDPGHGGEDAGVTAAGVTEKDLTLTYAKALRDRLAVEGVIAVLTREQDVLVPAVRRASAANEAKGQLFVSLHVNASAAAHQSGQIVMTYRPGFKKGSAKRRPSGVVAWEEAQEGYAAQSRQWAARLLQELEGMGFEQRPRLMEGPLLVLRGVAMPAVLVELGMLPQPDEMHRLQDPAWMNRCVEALTRAVLFWRDQLRRNLPEGRP